MKYKNYKSKKSFKMPRKALGILLLIVFLVSSYLFLYHLPNTYFNSALKYKNNLHDFYAILNTSEDGNVYSNYYSILEDSIRDEVNSRNKKDFDSAKFFIEKLNGIYSYFERDSVIFMDAELSLIYGNILYELTDFNGNEYNDSVFAEQDKIINHLEYSYEKSKLLKNDSTELVFISNLIRQYANIFYNTNWRFLIDLPYEGEDGYKIEFNNKNIYGNYINRINSIQIDNGYENRFLELFKIVDTKFSEDEYLKFIKGFSTLRARDYPGLMVYLGSDLFSNDEKLSRVGLLYGRLQNILYGFWDQDSTNIINKEEVISFLVHTARNNLGSRDYRYARFLINESLPTGCGDEPYFLGSSYNCSEKESAIKVFENWEWNSTNENWSNAAIINFYSSYIYFLDLNKSYNKMLKVYSDFLKIKDWEKVFETKDYGPLGHISLISVENYFRSIFYPIAKYKFSKSDWRGATDAYNKALKYGGYNGISNVKGWGVPECSFLLRNMFASKWNTGENGDKLGACDDLRIAAELDPESYYDYYLKNCSN